MRALSGWRSGAWDVPPRPRRARRVSCMAVRCAECRRESRCWPQSAAVPHRRRAAHMVPGGRARVLGSAALHPARRTRQSGHGRRRAVRGSSYPVRGCKWAPIRDSARRSRSGGLDAVVRRSAAGSRASGPGRWPRALETWCRGRGGCRGRCICVSACRDTCAPGAHGAIVH